MIRILSASLLYFAIVFGVGFLLGMVRVPFLVPRLGEFYAELIEVPFLLVAIYLTARWLVRRYGFFGEILRPLIVGILAAAMLLAVEFSVVLWLRGLTIKEFLATRDPIAAVVYYLAVGVFAVMPAILSRRTLTNG